MLMFVIVILCSFEYSNIRGRFSSNTNSSSPPWVDIELLMLIFQEYWASYFEYKTINSDMTSSLSLQILFLKTLTPTGPSRSSWCPNETRTATEPRDILGTHSNAQPGFQLLFFFLKKYGEKRKKKTLEETLTGPQNSSSF